MAKLKIKMNGEYVGIRFLLSTIIASGFDSIFFGIIAFYGTLGHYNLFMLIVTMWLIKVIIEILGLPISIRLAKKLKIIEKSDIYDNKTKFNLFSLDTKYTNEDNQFIHRGQM